MSDLEGLARRQLAGVGDPSAGEWVERTKIVHVRRRLSESEVMLLPPDRRVLVDARDWPLDDIVDRFAPILAGIDRKFHPMAWSMVREEIGR